MLFPERVLIASLAEGGVEVADEVAVVVLDHPVDEVGGDAVAGIVAGGGDAAAGDLGPFGFRFVMVKAEVVSQAFDEPPWGAGCSRVAPASAAVGLDDVDQFVNHGPFGLALQVLPEPTRGAADPVAWPSLP